MHWMQGCDASVLLNSTGNSTSEKDANTNRNLEGFNVIDDIKSEIEKECKGIVSCADILTLATRDAVSLQVSCFNPIACNPLIVTYSHVK